MKRWLLRFSITIGLLALCALLLLVALDRLYGHSSAKNVRIVLPTSYHGTFSIVVDPEHGEPVRKENGTYIFVIPPSGVLRVQTADPLLGWSRQRIVYSNGKDVTQKEDPTGGHVIAGTKITKTENGSVGVSTEAGTTFEFKIK